MTSKEIKQKKEIHKEIIETIPASDHSIKKANGNNTYQQKIEPNLDLIAAWVRDGLSEAQIVANLGISKQTLQTYKGRYPEFKEIFDKNRQRLDYVNMINAYQRRAEGYTTIELEQEFKVLDDGTRKLVKEKKRERHIPADPRALENWIQLRMKNDPMWGELRAILHDKNVELGGEGGLVFIPAKKVLELQNDKTDNMDTTTPTDGVHE